MFPCNYTLREYWFVPYSQIVICTNIIPKIDDFQHAKKNEMISICSTSAKYCVCAPYLTGSQQPLVLGNHLYSVTPTPINLTLHICTHKHTYIQIHNKLTKPTCSCATSFCHMSLARATSVASLFSLFWHCSRFLQQTNQKK